MQRIIKTIGLCRWSYYFNIEDIVKNGTFNIISTNNPDEATFSEIYSGNNKYIITEEFDTDSKTNQKIITYK